MGDVFRLHVRARRKTMGQKLELKAVHPDENGKTGLLPSNQRLTFWIDLQGYKFQTFYGVLMRAPNGRTIKLYTYFRAEKKVDANGCMVVLNFEGFPLQADYLQQDPHKIDQPVPEMIHCTSNVWLFFASQVPVGGPKQTSYIWVEVFTFLGN